MIDSDNNIQADKSAPVLPHQALALGYKQNKRFNSMVERIENAMRIVAILIAEEGEVYLPIFQRLERELEEHKKKEMSLKRALELSNSAKFRDAD